MQRQYAALQGSSSRRSLSSGYGGSAGGVGVLQRGCSSGGRREMEQQAAAAMLVVLAEEARTEVGDFQGCMLFPVMETTCPCYLKLFDASVSLKYIKEVPRGISD